MVRTGKRARFLLLFLLALSAAGCAVLPIAKGRGPFLYEIERDPPAYLFGTVHLPDKRVIDIPPVVLDALTRSDVLYNEIRLVPAEKPEFAEPVPEQEPLPPLDERLPESVYSRVQSQLLVHGKSPHLFDRAPIWAVTQQLPLVRYLGVPELPLDFVLAVKAQQAGLALEGLETPSEQLEVLGSRDPQAEIRALERALDSMERAQREGADPLEELVQVYLAGDERTLDKFLRSQIDVSDPDEVEYVEALLDQRSSRMAESIAQVLASNDEQAFFFAIGAAHLVGAQNVRQSLREQGFRIRRVTR